MAEHDDRREKLPVTAEVGSEGGSFADPTVQVATFEGDVARRGHDGASSLPSRAPEPADAAGGGTADAPSAADGIVRYPTEPPAGRRTSGRAWRTGLVGAVAGAAVALGLTRLRKK